MSKILKREALFARLVELGARTAFISEVCSVSTRRIRDEYLGFHAQQPPRGKVPDDPHWFLKTPTRNIQSSMLAVKFKQIGLYSGDPSVGGEPSVISDEGANRLCDSFEDWQGKLNCESELDFTRAQMLLTSHLRSGQLGLEKCGSCSGSHLVLVGAKTKCPHCQQRKELADSRRKHREIVGIDDDEKLEEQATQRGDLLSYS